MQKETGKHNRANSNAFISKTTVNSIIKIISNLIKKNILNSAREADSYSVQIDSTQNITSTDKCLVILHFLRWSIEEKLLAAVDSYFATGADLFGMVKGVLANQNIHVSKCIFDNTDGVSNISGQYKRFIAFLEKESLGHMLTL